MMRTLLAFVVALVACSEPVTAPTVCEGRLVHYRVAMALQARGEATCEPTGDADGSWTCSCDTGDS